MKNIKLLLVEDSDDDACLVLREFEEQGIRTYSKRVESSAELKDVLDSEPWDVVISDYRMPRFSGITALAIVRTRFPRLPFIMLSGDIQEQVANIAVATGATAFAKKEDMGQLVAIVVKEVRRARKAGQAEAM